MYSHYGVSYFCSLFGKSRQAWYEQMHRGKEQQLSTALVLKLVEEIRMELPRIGVVKLYPMLKAQFIQHGIKMGRDALYDLLSAHGYLLTYRRRKPYTTDSNHRFKKYPNLIREMLLSKAGQLWVSDITYLRLTNGFCYLSIITDAYSRKIVGYQLHRTLHSDGVVSALQMALCDRVGRRDRLIHHSDRGTQYCCKDYVEKLERHNIQISMTEKGDPYENAIAERVNGILKYEFNLRSTFSSFEEALQQSHHAIKQYNTIRPHSSCDYLTPIQAHEMTGLLKKRWKSRIYQTSDADASPG